MTDQEKIVLGRFFIEKVNEYQQQGADKWLAEFFLKTKAQQKVEVVAWLDAKRAKNQSDIDALEARKLATENLLSAENSAIDAIKTSL